MNGKVNFEGGKMKTISDVTGITYENKEVVYFRNLYQSTFYIDNNATIVDVFTDGNKKLVFVFWRDQHEKLIKLWLENKGQDDK
jgi:hypothetical protein